jgi:flagellar motor switch protein FliN
MGAFTNALGTEWGASVSSSTIEVEEFDVENSSIEIEDSEMILISQSIEEMGDSSIVLILPHDFSTALFEKAGPMVGSDSNEMTDSIGLNVSEMDDLSKVTTFPDEAGGGGDGFAAMSSATGASSQNIDMLLDVDLDVSIELGSSMLSIKRILELAPGSIVELDRMAGEPVDLLVNNKVVAKGEVVVIDENFGIRIVSLVSPQERIRSLR